MSFQDVKGKICAKNVRLTSHIPEETDRQILQCKNTLPIRYFRNGRGNTFLCQSGAHLSNLWWMPESVSLLSWFILIHSKGKPTWDSVIGCGVLFELSWWDRFHDRAKTYAVWVWYLSRIGELWVIFWGILGLFLTLEPVQIECTT